MVLNVQKKKKILWEKRESIASYKQFFLCPQNFQKIFTADTLSMGLFLERVKGILGANLGVKI